MDQNPQNLMRLLSLHADEMLDDAQQQELFVLLDKNSDAQDAYIEQMMFQAIMLHRSSGRGKFSQAELEGLQNESLPEIGTPVCDLTDLNPNDIWGIAPVYDTSTQTAPSSSLLGFLANCFQSNGPFLAKCMISLVALLPVVLLFFVMNDTKVEQLPVVAKILRQTEGTQWGGDTIAPAGSKVLLGQRLRIQDGTVELHMASGVHVLLEGNTSLFFTGPNALYLERGSLVALVVPDAIGFTVRAPDADFVDLGTEFGVIVDPGEMSKTKVLAGKINVETENKNGKRAQKQLYTNEAAQITQNGDVELIDPNSLTFTSVYPDDRVCLFDLICRSKNSYYPDGLWIDPVDGDLKMPCGGKYILGETISRTSIHEYWITPSLPVVDGIFTPISGKQTFVNSKGGRFGEIGNGTNVSFCCFCIGETKAIANWNVVDDHIRGILSGINEIGSGLSTGNHPFMYLHSNLGITFDLDAVRQEKGRKVVQLLAMAKKLEDIESGAESKPTVLDLLVLADEKIIYEKRGVTCEDGAFPMRIDIPENTRFLSIISADGKDTHTFDHLVLDRPAFVLENKTLRKGSRPLDATSAAKAR